MFLPASTSLLRLAVNARRDGRSSHIIPLSALPAPHVRLQIPILRSWCVAPHIRLSVATLPGQSRNGTVDRAFRWRSEATVPFQRRRTVSYILASMAGDDAATRRKRAENRGSLKYMQSAACLLFCLHRQSPLLHLPQAFV